MGGQHEEPRGHVRVVLHAHQQSHLLRLGCGLDLFPMRHGNPAVHTVNSRCGRASRWPGPSSACVSCPSPARPPCGSFRGFSIELEPGAPWGPKQLLGVPEVVNVAHTAQVVCCDERQLWHTDATVLLSTRLWPMWHTGQRGRGGRTRSTHDRTLHTAASHYIHTAEVSLWRAGRSAGDLRRPLRAAILP